MVRNVGQLPVLLPWSPDGLIPDGLQPVGTRTPRAAIRLEVRSADGTERLAALRFYVLAGVPSIQGSLQRLAPGQSAHLRVPARWQSFSAGDFEQVMARSHIRLVATLSVTLADGAMILAASDPTEALITLRSRQQ